ncbi:MAG TPA: response regulator receiver protein, partial [Arthrobacter sp.]|nr:response regulator receiver protein [Arthrobacter sp.]
MPPSQDSSMTELISTVDQVQNLILDSADFEEFLNELARFSA